MEGLLLILIGVFMAQFIRDNAFLAKCAIGLAIVLIFVSGGK